jgi:hypothetical protein
MSDLETTLRERLATVAEPQARIVSGLTEELHRRHRRRQRRLAVAVAASGLLGVTGTVLLAGLQPGGGSTSLQQQAGSAPHAAGEGCPLPMSIGPDSELLRVEPPAEGFHPTIDESRARMLASNPPAQPGDASSVTAFRLGRVTTEGTIGFDNGVNFPKPHGLEAWVALHQVPEGEHLPNAGNGAVDTRPYRWAVLVDARTGAVAEWEGGLGSGCS